MMAADSLHAAVHLIVPSGMSFRLLPPCRRAYSACAFAPHFALSPAQPSNVQASCLERARPAAIGAFAGGLTAPPGRRRPERQRRAKAEGKTKGCGTCRPVKPVCTWGERGTERLCRRAAFGARGAPAYVAKYGRPATPDDLAKHVCLRQKLSSGRILPWVLRSAPGFEAPVGLTASVIDPLLDLTHAGAGIALLPDFLLRDALADGSLVPILEGEMEQTGVLTMLWPASRFRVPKVRAFVDWITQYVQPRAGDSG
ncbi:LysR family transcriptional regulator [Bordetella ansorpii]|uniref:LysR family transcriptional regulator n=1 Tax=Bordetella ansorpii TaxID=288768 RepID=A0A157SSX3_9BORD|nr:LysR substrate-binding domain-containing protein [Bordetella ansorpii]SAI73542.1 LysR family transcriptional regulator [Bordetella ansorpii]